MCSLEFSILPSHLLARSTIFLRPPLPRADLPALTPGVSHVALNLSLTIGTPDKAPIKFAPCGQALLTAAQPLDCPCCRASCFSFSRRPAKPIGSFVETNRRARHGRGQASRDAVRAAVTGSRPETRTPAQLLSPNLQRSVKVMVLNKKKDTNKTCSRLQTKKPPNHQKSLMSVPLTLMTRLRPRPGKETTILRMATGVRPSGQTLVLRYSASCSACEDRTDFDLWLLLSQFNDVSQNYGADDCSLLSAAASLAWADPEALKSLFKPLECGKDRNEGMVVRVSLFDFSQDEAPSREFAIPVTQTSESFVVDGQARDANSWSWTAGGPIWVGSEFSTIPVSFLSTS